MANIQAISQTTQRLVQHCIDHHEKRVSVLDPAVVRQAVEEEEEGADVHHLFELTTTPAAFELTCTVKETILHYILLHGDLDCVAALLWTPKPIDFTVVDEKGMQVFDRLLDRPDDGAITTILYLIVQRLKISPTDRHQLGERRFVNQFFSKAAEQQQLSLFWSRLKHIVSTDGAVDVRHLVPLEEYKKLEEEDRSRFTFCKGVESCEVSTRLLVELFLSDSGSPDPVDVKACVQSYADVCAMIPGSNESVLSCALRFCSVECVAALLNTPLPLHSGFDIKYVYSRHSVEELKAVLRLLISSPKGSSLFRDKTSFCLPLASELGVLSDVWPIVRSSKMSEEVYQRNTKLSKVYAYDWAKLVEEDPNHPFEVGSHAMVHASEATLALARLSFSPFPDLNLVEGYIREGADIGFECCQCTTLSRMMIISARVAAVDGALVLQSYPKNGNTEEPCGCTLVPSSELENSDRASTLLNLWLSSIVHLGVRTADSAEEISELQERRKNELRISGILDLLLQRIPFFSREPRSVDYFPLPVYFRAAARIGLFSLFWSKVEHLLRKDREIFILEKVALGDFVQLPEADRYSPLVFLSGVEGCAKKTAELLALFQTSHHPDVGAVSACVQAYADVLCPFQDFQGDVLRHALRDGDVECVAALLSTPLPLPPSTAFQAVFERVSVEEMKVVLPLVMDRLRKHPREVISLNDFLRRAAECGVLHDVWSILRDVLPSLQEKLHQTDSGPIVLSTVWWDDWEALRASFPEEHCFSFSPNIVIHRENSTTAALARLSCSNVPNPTMVERYVLNGANMNLQWCLGSIPSRLVLSGSVNALAAALKTEVPINFTPENAKGDRTRQSLVLNDICSVKDVDVAAAMLDMMVERLQTHPEDRYDFGATSLEGENCLSCAARHDRLALFWNRLKDFPYYADNTGCIFSEFKIPLDD